jgi:probable aminopeptidase NPEPL1
MYCRLIFRFGGLWGVGKASEHPPALVVLSYVPAAANKTLALVGKGIVFDTGGLSIKGSTYMPTMKCDMGGAASVMAGFEAAVLSGTKVALHAVLCIAENSVDARSTRPDDILQLYSGKTVEINNTDAEGRLVLADGVAYATKHLNPDILIDMATLTGAQSFATGNIHCGVMSNSSELEQTIVTAGKKSGDLAFPLIYSPEFLGIEKQFSSEVADFKNSVKDRTNASSAGAGHFIEENLIGDKWSWKNGDRKDTGLYAHLDIAAPAFTSDRGTGFGVALLLETIKSLE